MTADDIDWDEDPPLEIVRWYERPGPLVGTVSQASALAGAFALGVITTLGVLAAARLVVHHDDDHED
jgi:hypothetical protein